MSTKKLKVISLTLATGMLVSSFAGSITGSADTLSDAIAIISQYAGNDNADGLTISQLDNAGVNADTTLDVNLQAYKDAIVAATEQGVDTTAEIQALVNATNLAEAIKKINNYAVNDTAAVMTIDELKDAGIIGLLDVNLEQYKAAINAASGFASDKSTNDMQVFYQTVINTVNAAETDTAIKAIESYDATTVASLTISQLIKAGVVGTRTDCLDTVTWGSVQYGYKLKIGAAAVGECNTLSKIQGIVNNVNATDDAKKADDTNKLIAATIVIIKGYAAEDNANSLTVQQLKDVGIKGVKDEVLAANLESYKTAIKNVGEADVDSTAKIQAIIDKINTDIATAKALKDAAINAIIKYASNDNAEALTITQLAAAGAVNTMDVNLSQYKDAIAKAAGIGVDTTEEIQAIIDNTNSSEKANAVAAIEAYTSDNVKNLTLTQLIKSGVVASGNTADAIVEANLPYYKVAIGSASAGAADTTAEIQAIITLANNSITAANAAIKAIEEYTAATAGSLTISQLNTAGCANLIDANIAAYRSAIGNAAAGAADSLDEIQSIINSVNAQEALKAAINKIEAYNVANDASSMTIKDLTDAGAVNTNADNLEYYKLAVASADTGKANETAKIQAIVDAVNKTQATVLIIRTYAANDNANDLTTAQLKDAGVTSVKDANLAAYKKAIADAVRSACDTTAKIQIIINTVNVAEVVKAIDKVEKFTSSTVAGMTIEDLAATDAANVRTANLGEYQKAFGNAADGAADTISEIQAIIDTVNASQEVATVKIISVMAGNDDASGLTLELLSQAGITNLLANNKTAYQAAISGSTADLTDTAAEIQAIINKVNADQIAAAIKAIDDYTTGTVSSLTIEQLQTAGVVTEEKNGHTPAIAANLDAYKAAVGTAVNLALDTIDEIQTLVDNVNTAERIKAAIAVINGYAINKNADALTNAQLVAACVLNTVDDAAHLAEYKSAIAASTGALTDTSDEIANIIAVANDKLIAINTIANYAAGDELTISVLKTVGISNIVDANLEAYKTKIGAATIAESDTINEIQNLVNAVNAEQIAAAVKIISDYAANDNASSLTIEKLVAAGITDVNAINLGTHNADKALSTGYIGIIERAISADADTTAEIQALINSINTTLSVAQISGTTKGTIVGDLPVGSADSSYVPTISINVTSDTVNFKASDLTTTGGTVILYTNSDYRTGELGADGIGITGNTTVLYVKVVSSNGISTKYYKIVLNVVDPSTKYVISGPAQFTKVGANYVATVQIDREKASSLTNPKLYVVYTFEDGVTQSFQTLNIDSADETTKDIVISAGIKSVQVFLVDGDVDWSAGTPTFKSNFIEINQ